MASDLAESPSVRMSVQFSLLRVPASLASSSVGMPGARRRRRQRVLVQHEARGTGWGRQTQPSVLIGGHKCSLAPCISVPRSLPCPAPPPARARHPIKLVSPRPPVSRERLAPSLFFMSLLALKEAKLSTASISPALATFLRYGSGSSHLEPKLEARSVSVSLVCGRGQGRRGRKGPRP